jgi:phytoene dehydrogenase-like protein
MKKIKILGAGISGLTAAINLSKAGYKVEVF